MTCYISLLSTDPACCGTGRAFLCELRTTRAWCHNSLISPLPCFIKRCGPTQNFFNTQKHYSTCCLPAKVNLWLITGLLEWWSDLLNRDTTERWSDHLRAAHYRSFSRQTFWLNRHHRKNTGDTNFVNDGSVPSPVPVSKASEAAHTTSGPWKWLS